MNIKKITSDVLIISKYFLDLICLTQYQLKTYVVVEVQSQHFLTPGVH